ncbi:MAG: hypothetical protein KGS47_15400 [Chloroflexi bacterium]|nr:hypothetical protein [Chloroflexota bacterium]
MIGRMLIVIGIGIVVLAGLLALAVTSTVGIAAGYQPSVQEYNHANVLIGLTLSRWLAGAGAMLALGGAIVALRRRRRR